MNYFDHIKEILKDDKIDDGDWSIHIAFTPSEDDRVITITPTPGVPPEEDYPRFTPGFQVRARSRRLGGQEALNKLIQIRNSLHSITNKKIYENFGNFTQLGTLSPSWTFGKVTATKFHFIFAESSIISLSLDDNERHNFAINFRSSMEFI